ncbi:MAG: pyridoxine 5'-phosphate synthase [Candidatus Omnitrophota bacterium]
MLKLGVNIDHVASLRQLRKSMYPDILLAAQICEIAGADSIVVHLREDRRHIHDNDVKALRRHLRKRLNLEMSIASDIVNIACKIKPDQATLVPEKRQELTTEGGLNVIKFERKIGKVSDLLKKSGIEVSLFIEPDHRQIKKARDLGVDMIELHTGHYADSKSTKDVNRHLSKIKAASEYAHMLGLVVNAGHGLDYNNTSAIVDINYISELNIGYSIICHSVFVGLKKAVSEMKKLLERR